MTLRLAAVACGTVAWLALPAQTAGPTGLVSSATVRVIRKPVHVQFVYIEPLREVPLVEWTFALARATSPDVPALHGHRLRHDFLPPPAQGPTKRPEVRVHRVAVDDAMPMVARMTLAVFADGVLDGTASRVGGLAYLRQQRDAAVRLRPDDPSRVRGRITQWLEGPRPRGWAFRQADALKDDVKTRLAAATRYRDAASAAIRAGHPGSQLSALVTARAAAGQGLDIVALVRNLRDTPLEAWDLAIHDGPASQHPESGRAWDGCGARDGRLARDDVREVYLEPGDGPEDRPLPVLVIKSAIWADQSWEGDAAAHAEQLRRRAATPVCRASFTTKITNTTKTFDPIASWASWASW
jgi:hypothetical protein